MKLKIGAIKSPLKIEISTKSELAGIPLEYNLKNNSDKIARIIQSYTPIINKEIWNKSG